MWFVSGANAQYACAHMNVKGKVSLTVTGMNNTYVENVMVEPLEYEEVF